LRTAALRGAVLTRGGAEGLPLLTEAIRGEDDALFAAALRSARELGDGDDVTAGLADTLPALADERKVRLMQTLGHRGGSAAGPAVLAQARDGSEAVRVAALKALTRMGYAPALDLMAQLAWAEEGPVAEVARGCLSYFPGEEGDAVLTAMLRNQQAPARVVAIELIGQGGLNEPVGLLMTAAESDTDEGVRVAALKALEDHAGMAEMPRLLDVLCKTQSKPEIQGAENALRALVGREKRTSSADVVIQKAMYGNLPGEPSADVTKKVAEMVKAGAMSVAATNANFGDPASGIVKKLQVNYTVNGLAFSKTVSENQTMILTAVSTPPAVVDAFCTAFDEMKGQDGPAAGALLRLLSATESPKAFQTVKTAAAQGEGELKQTAQRVLCEWPTSEALPVVMEMAKTASEPTLKVLAVRGAVRLLKQSDADAAERLQQYATLMALAPRADEKKLVLSGLALMPRMDALDMVFAQFADEAVKAEAAQAAVTICDALGKSAKEDPSIFNGKDLTGWDATTDYWRFDDGAIVGRSKKPIPETTYVWSNVEVADFYFAADVKLDPPTANSGIQFRSKKIDEAGHALGYQGDIGQNVWSRIYHQGGRGKLDWNGRAEEAVKPGEWNRFEILAIGPAIWTAINGKLGVACLDLAGKDERSGLIAFQIHTGPPQTVRYRNLKLVHNPPVELAGLKADKLIPELAIPGQP
jgi:hypothetical protein